VRSVQLATYVGKRPTLAGQPMRKITMVTSAPRAITAQKVRGYLINKSYLTCSPKSANLATSTLLRAWSSRKTADCVNLAPSRTYMDKKAAKSAVSSLTPAKVKISASASARTELIQPQMPHADARVALTISMTMSSQRVMSVISLIASHWSTTTVNSMATIRRDSLMELVYRRTNALKLVLASLESAPLFLVSALVRTQLLLTRFATRTAGKIPPRPASLAQQRFGSPILTLLKLMRKLMQTKNAILLMLTKTNQMLMFLWT